MRTFYGCVLLIALLATETAGKVTRFPEQSRAPSPDGRYTLINVNQDREPHHVIWLQNLAKKNRQELYRYVRHADVLWSPDSSHVAVNDYGGSDFAVCLIFSVPNGKETLHIDGNFLIQKLATGGQGNSIRGNHHVYIHATRWLGPKTIQIQADGYGDVDPHGFKFVYEYTLGKQPKIVRR